MITLHLKKTFFDSIKNGEKKIEFRPDTQFYKNLFKSVDFGKLNSGLKKDYVIINIACGYPKKEDREKNLKCYLTHASWVNNDHSILYANKVNECYDLKKYPWFICLEIEPIRNFN